MNIILTRDEQTLLEFALKEASLRLIDKEECDPGRGHIEIVDKIRGLRNKIKGAV